MAPQAGAVTPQGLRPCWPETLYVFVFLVAPGIDYSIFLMTRVWEEANRREARHGALTALAATGPGAAAADSCAVLVPGRSRRELTNDPSGARSRRLRA